MIWLPLSLALAQHCDEATDPVYAASVVSFDVGPGVEPGYADPTNALGPPDFHEGAGAVSLGNRGNGSAELVVSLGKAVVFDGPGPDLTVHEQGPSAEPTDLAVSADGATWHPIGVIRGAVHSVDLKGKVPAGQRFGLVRLRTASKRTTAGPWAGPDIDAVEVLHACIPPARPNA
jgi:hypothetical protein